MDETELTKKYNSIYLEIIMRYRDYIEEKEGLYVAELPKLITPENDSVALVAKGIKERFAVYNYSDNFVEAATHAYEYVNGIDHISLPIQFWLKPAETIKYGAGDVFDRAALLCSLLIALGEQSAKVVISVGESDRAFGVYFERNGRYTLMELGKETRHFQSIDEMVKALGVGKSDEITAYEFNDKMYRDIA